MFRTNQARASLHQHIDSAYALQVKRYFKQGQRAENKKDRFIGIRVPQIRQVARRFDFLNLKELKPLLKSVTHEERFLALAIMVKRMKKAPLKEKKELFNFYHEHIDHINNWDLIDISAPTMVGLYLELEPQAGEEFINTMAKSSSLWHRRIALLSTFQALRKGTTQQAIQMATMLCYDDEDLVQKAVGWTLREIGKVDRGWLEAFLEKHAMAMPRITLSYALEKFDQADRRYYMAKKKGLQI